MASAVIKATGRSQLLLSTSPDLESPSQFAGVLDAAAGIYTFELSGLDPDTEYHYGFLNSIMRGRFRTPPLPGSEASFTIAAASCAQGFQYGTGPTKTSNSPVFQLIRDREPLMFIHMGDMHYRNITTNSVSSFRQAYRDVMRNARQAEMYRNVPTAYIFDDHDYSANDGDKTSASRPAAHQAYREFVPHHPLPADILPGGTGETFHSFAVGRVRFILLDVRSSRDPNSNPDGPSKSMLGSVQKQWFKDTLLAATEPVIVVMSGVVWNGAQSDKWGGFATEREELAMFFEDNDLTRRLILLQGDRHWAAADDGTNMQYDPRTTDPGPMSVLFSPMDSSISNPPTGIWSEGIHADHQQQYGIIEFDDQGDQVVATATAFWVEDVTTEHELFTLSKAFPAS